MSSIRCDIAIDAPAVRAYLLGMLKMKRTTKTVGGRIALQRDAAEITKQDMADMLGVSLSTYQRYEADDVTVSVEALVAVSRRLGVSLEWLATGRVPK